MIQDARLNPLQEMTYVRNYTEGKMQELEDNYRKREQSNPAATVCNL